MNFRWTTALISAVLAMAAAYALFPLTLVKGNPAMSTKPLIDTRVPAVFRTATFAMG
jgi:hypothetical protein